jgi:hypothetical protein
MLGSWALAIYGSPGQILTDDGKVFTGRFNHLRVEVLFDAVYRERGIEHLLTQPPSSTTTGHDWAVSPECAGGILLHGSAFR